MKKYTLLLLPLVFSLMGCNRSTCKIKITTTGHVTIKGLKEGSDTITATIGQNLKLHLQGEYYHNIETTWKVNPDITQEGELNDPNQEYVIESSNIQVLVDGELRDDAFLFAQNTRNKTTLTLKKEFVKKNVEIKIDPQPYKGEMGLCLFGCELNTGIKDRYEKGEIKISFESAYQNQMFTIKSLGGLAFPVIEDDTMIITLKVDRAKSNEPLPENIWYRTNARYAEINNEFTRKYKDKNYECTISVPHYVMKDHCEIRVKE